MLLKNGRVLFMSMTVLKQNILANFLGKSWSILMGLAFIPLYIKFLGIEVYGLIGIFVTLQVTVQLLEFGLSATMNREMARYSVRPELSEEACDLARTLEIVYWIVGIAIGVGICCIAPWIASNWVRVENLPRNLVQQAIGMMGVTIAIQWPFCLYSGGLTGLEKQVLLNTIIAFFGTMRGLGAVLVLWLIAPNPTVFFSWQIFIGIIQVIAMMFFFWRSMPVRLRLPHFNVKALQGVWRFTVGMGATGIVTFFLSQLDKVVLSKVLSLTLFGYYILAKQLDTATQMSSSAIFTAFMPRFSALIAQKQESALRKLYHQGCQLISLVVLPASAIIAFFSFDLVSIWMGNDNIARMISPIVSILVFGSALNSMLGLPYDLTVAYGWASFGFYQNLISSILLVPLMIILAIRFGGMGAAMIWLILHIGYLLVSAPIIHFRILRGELRQWYLIDVGRPFVISSIIVGFGWWFRPRNLAIGLELLLIFAIWLATLFICAISLPHIRYRIWDFITTEKCLSYVFKKSS